MGTGKSRAPDEFNVDNGADHQKLLGYAGLFNRTSSRERLEFSRPHIIEDVCALVRGRERRGILLHLERLGAVALAQSEII